MTIIEPPTIVDTRPNRANNNNNDTSRVQPSKHKTPYDPVGGAIRYHA